LFVVRLLVKIGISPYERYAENALNNI